MRSRGNWPQLIQAFLPARGRVTCTRFISPRSSACSTGSTWTLQACTQSIYWRSDAVRDSERRDGHAWVLWQLPASPGKAVFSGAEGTRYSDEQLYALALYILSLKAPANANHSISTRAAVKPS